MGEEKQHPDGMSDKVPESRYVMPSERYKREPALTTETPVHPKAVENATFAPEFDDSESRLSNLEEWVRGEKDKIVTLLWEETFWAEILNEAIFSAGTSTWVAPGGTITVGNENGVPQCIRFADAVPNNRWKYKWREVVKSTPKYSVVGGDAITWVPPTLSPRTWLSENDYARNVIENRNIANGLCGNGVNMVNKIAGQESYLPAPPKAIVRMREEVFKCDDGSGEEKLFREYWFQYENEVNDANDVHCTSTGTQMGGGWTTTVT